MNIEELKLPLTKLVKKELQASSIVVYGVILFHTYTGEKTWVTNKTLADECGISERTVKNCLTELKDKKCIDVRYEQEGRFQIRYITPLILFELKVVPGNYKPIDNGGFEEYNPDKEKAGNYKLK